MTTAETPPPPAWPAAAATGLGAMPGHDVAESLRVIVGEVPELPFLPVLPARGVGADPVGRSIALLVDIWADVVPSGWRVSRRPSRDVRRGRDLLDRDLDTLEELASAAGTVKLQVCGPWTLGAELETSAGNRMLTDAGAMDDLVASLAEGLAQHVAEVRRRLPHAGLVVQLEERLLPAVLAGALPTASGLSTVRAVEEAVVRDGLRAVLAAVPGVRTALDAGRRPPPWSLLGAVGFDAVRVDFTSLGRTAAELDPVGEALNAGTVLLAGVIPPAAPANGPAVPLAERARPITEPLRALGFPDATLASLIVPTPAGGLDAVPGGTAVQVLRSAREVARLLAEGAGADGLDDHPIDAHR
ncbi:methionine synthase [Nakamurella deserti]|uniref:methionine synthase n=1 Tax=Nakamurella deserti TaxID=2164074 RepID=UPI00197CB2A4|nr:methionine synthase [Nakamurella deserti]